jgi:hypothetical protein
MTLSFPAATLTDRVGGGLTPAVLPHHRTCGSDDRVSEWDNISFITMSPLLALLAQYPVRRATIPDVSSRRIRAAKVSPGIHPGAAACFRLDEIQHGSILDCTPNASDPLMTVAKGGLSAGA